MRAVSERQTAGGDPERVEAARLSSISSGGRFACGPDLTRSVVQPEKNRHARRRELSRAIADPRAGARSSSTKSPVSESPCAAGPLVVEQNPAWLVDVDLVQSAARPSGDAARRHHERERALDTRCPSERLYRCHSGSGRRD